jgi:hypothetical protein
MSGKRHLIVGGASGGVSCKAIGAVYPVHPLKTMMRVAIRWGRPMRKGRHDDVDPGVPSS